MSQIRKAVIPAAGLGTRFYPLTRAQPKEMLPILDKPIIHYVVEEAINSGLDEILLIVGAGKDSIINYFDSNHIDDHFSDNSFENMPEIFFVRQREQLGLADSIRYAEKFVGSDPFIVLLGDTIYKSSTSNTVTSQLIEVFNRYNKPTIAVEKVPKDKIKDYGIITGHQIESGIWKVESMIEKPMPKDVVSNIGITGTYILTEEIFSSIKKLRPGRNGEYQLTDALSMILQNQEVIGAEFKGTRYDIGTKELWIRAFFAFASNDDRYKALL